MVTFKLKSKENGIYIYEYYPNGDFSKKAGVIRLDTVAQETKIEKVAEDDYLQVITAKELNESREWISKTRQEEDLSPLTEKAWPLEKQDLVFYYYGAYVESRIIKDLKNNSLLEEGFMAWG